MVKTRKLFHLIFDACKRMHLPTAACAPLHTHAEYRACCRGSRHG